MFNLFQPLVIFSALASNKVKVAQNDIKEVLLKKASEEVERQLTKALQDKFGNPDGTKLNINIDVKIHFE